MSGSLVVSAGCFRWQRSEQMERFVSDGQAEETKKKTGGQSRQAVIDMTSMKHCTGSTESYNSTTSQLEMMEYPVILPAATDRKSVV